MEQLTEHFERVATVFDRSSSILLLNPEGGDGDSLGSTLALSQHLRSKGKTTSIFSAGGASPMYSYLPSFHEIQGDPEKLDLTMFDCIVTADLADLAMTGIEGRLKTLDRSRTTIVNIDHHPTNLNFGDVNVVDASYAAATELLFALFEHHGWPIEQEVATCLLTGILTDTGMFTNRNTTHHSLNIAATLLSRGARLRTIHSFAYRNKSIGSLRVWGRALSRLQRNPETDIVSTFILQRDLDECGVDYEDVDGIANFLNNLEEAKAILVLRETDDGRIKGSFRTTGDEVNVAKLAEQFGGGGHRRAAGFSLAGRIVENGEGWKVV